MMAVFGMTQNFLFKEMDRDNYSLVQQRLPLPAAACCLLRRQTMGCQPRAEAAHHSVLSVRISGPSELCGHVCQSAEVCITGFAAKEAGPSVLILPLSA